MREERLIQVQIYYEIAMSIGNSLDLKKMLRESLSTYLRKLSCPAGMVLIKQKKQGSYIFTPVISIPRSMDRDLSCRTILESKPRELNEEELSFFLDSLPINRMTEEGRYYHVMELKGFGLLLLIRGSSPLDYSIIHSLKPLNDKLSEACASCLQNQEMKRLKAESEKLSITDRLTGAMNRQFFDIRLREEIARYGRSRSPFSLIMFDIDDFKKINDTYGHLEGDRILIEVASCVRSNIRSTDFFVRWGGEEFIVLSLTGEKGSVMLAEKLRKKLEAHAPLSNKSVTASFGVAEYSEGMDMDKIVALADYAMYRAKKMGKNRVESSSIPMISQL